MQGRARVYVIALAPVAGLAGCSDVVVGQFDGSGTQGTAAGGSASSSTGLIAEGSTATDETGAVPATCFSDDFEDGVISEALWNTWVEEDAAIEEVDGTLVFKPPSYGLFDTGVAGHFDYAFPLRDGTVRVRIADPPAIDRPTGIFLIVDQDEEAFLIDVGQGTVGVRRSVSEVPTFSDEFPVDPFPGWLGFRAEDSVLYFETSSDGETWTAISSYAQTEPFTAAHALLMSQTFGSYPEQTTVAVDDFEVCYR